MHRWLEYCVNRARVRETAMRYHLCAVIIRGGAVQASGDNRPVDEFPGKIFNPMAHAAVGLHAEMDCIRCSHPENLDGGVLYVGGVTPGKSLITSKPCDLCMDTITQTGLKKIVWHDNLGETQFLRLRANNRSTYV